MKNILYFFFFLISIQPSAAQDVTIKKTWIGSHMEYLKITDTILCLNNNSSYSGLYYSKALDHHGFQCSDSILRLDKYGFILQYDSFRITKLTKDTMILTPLNDNAIKVFYKNPHEDMQMPLHVSKHTPLIFVDSATIDDKNFGLQKIIFRNGQTMVATNTAYQLEIDSDGTVFYFGMPIQKPYDKNTAAKLYKGQLSKSDLDSLIDIMKHSALDIWPDDIYSCSDGGDSNYIIFYNRKSIYKHLGCIFPEMIQRFTYFVDSCRDRASLKLSEEKHVFSVRPPLNDSHSIQPK